MRTLIIVDDENMIRDGLSRLVNWKDFGFTVCGVFADGKDAVEYLMNNSVDVVLTDINMTFMSGIDVAKYVDENCKGTQTVILSGYQEFEYARKAIQYNVIEYLLKPVSIEDITQTFNKISKNLDEQEKINPETIGFFKTQFLSDVAFGALINNDEISKRAELLGIARLVNMPCALISITINDFNDAAKVWKHGVDRLYLSICNLLGAIGNDFYEFSTSDGVILGIIFSVALDSKKWSDQMTRTIQDEIGISISVDFKIEKHNIMEIAKSYYTDVDFRDIYRIERMIMVHINDNNPESAKNLYLKIARMVDNVVNLRDITIQMMSMIVGKIMECNIGFKIGSNFSYSNIALCKTIEEVQQVCCNAIENLCNISAQNYKAAQSDVINRVREYIDKNLYKDISLEQVADYVFFSSTYLSRLFKESTGENFIDYIIRMRMERAALILIETDIKIYEVCQKVGYDNVKYFHKIFKKFFECTPNEYRSNHRRQK